MKSLLLALEFLTIFPVKVSHFEEKMLARSAIYFPLIGYFLGFILIGINALFYKLGSPQIAINTVLVVSLIILSGGLHLDGLADSSDAIFSGKSKKEELLAIMRDSRIGTMGVLSLIAIILLKIALLSSIKTGLKPLILLSMCAISRWSMVLALFLFPYARETGKAKAFAQRMNFKVFALSLAIAFIPAFIFWKAKGIIVFIVIAFFTYIFGEFIKNKIGGITGDVLGALCELNEAAVLLFFILA